MRIYENDVVASLDVTKVGFLTGLVYDAERDFAEEDASTLGFSDAEYSELEGVSFAPKNVDASSVDTAVRVVDGFLSNADDEHRKLVEAMTDKQKFTLGMDLFSAVLYAGVIKKSVDGDARVFCL